MIMNGDVGGSVVDAGGGRGRWACVGCADGEAEAEEVSAEWNEAEDHQEELSPKGIWNRVV